MFYKFPEITTLDEFRAALIPGLNLREAVGDGYVTFNYNNLNPDNFPWPLTEDWHYMMRECRGIAFDLETGECVSRPFHKFFNYGERPETSDLPLNSSTVFSVANKEDGSMVHPLYLKIGNRLATRNGITDISMRAENFIATKRNYLDFIKFTRKMRATPIFEYVAPDNRIVLNYEEENLILLGIRFIENGSYVAEEMLDVLAEEHGIPVRKAENSVSFSDMPLDVIKSLGNQKENTEGVVVTFDTGHRLKIKTEWYVKLHRYVDMFKNDRWFVRGMFDETFDDVYASAEPETKARIKKCLDKIDQAVWNYRDYILELFDTVLTPEASRKQHAEEIFSVPKHAQSIIFKMLDGKNSDLSVQNMVFNLIKVAASNTKKWDTLIENVPGLDNIVER